MNPQQPLPESSRPVSPSAKSEKDQAADFARAANEAQPGFFAELLDFIVHNKKWWLTPIILVMLLLGVFILLLATPVAPFIYTLF